jgi:DNA-binding GntR family transcriptional regulator
LPHAARQTLGESVADSLREAILGGRFKPGDRLAQAQVAGELGVSQAPVRDALGALEREGLVERSANNGAVVIALAAADIEEIFSLRTALEVLGVRLATRQATAEDLDELEENIRALERVQAPARAAALDLQFHELLMRTARHGRLLSCWQTLHAQLRLALVQQGLVNPEFPRQVVKAHRQLLAQIRARDEDRAAALVEEQLEGFHQWALKLNPEPHRP